MHTLSAVATPVFRGGKENRCVCTIGVCTIGACTIGASLKLCSSFSWLSLWLWNSETVRQLYFSNRYTPSTLAGKLSDVLNYWQPLCYGVCGVMAAGCHSSNTLNHYKSMPPFLPLTYELAQCCMVHCPFCIFGPRFSYSWLLFAWWHMACLLPSLQWSTSWVSWQQLCVRLWIWWQEDLPRCAPQCPVPHCGLL